jgi:YesN/AraC family two-component response regulator
MQKILIIEDETQTRDIFLKCLILEGFDALGAESAAMGIKLAKLHLPDLIVCDIMMPDSDGYSVLSVLHQQASTAKIPFIFLTAKVTMTDLRRGMELGADDYLTKPCTVEQFLSAITTRLRRHETIKSCHLGLKQANTTSSSYESLHSNPNTIFPHCPKLAHVFQFIEANYSQPISLTDVADAVGYSPAYLTNLVQSQTGRTVKRWVIERRMTQARTLLITTSQSIHQIAAIVGYPDTSYFVRQFKQIHSISPQVWRNSMAAS